MTGDREQVVFACNQDQMRRVFHSSSTRSAYFPVGNLNTLSEPTFLTQCVLQNETKARGSEEWTSEMGSAYWVIFNLHAFQIQGEKKLHGDLLLATSPKIAIYEYVSMCLNSKLSGYRVEKRIYACID